MTIKEGFEDAVEVTPVVMTLEAVLSDGLDAVPRNVQKALKADDYSRALSEANGVYSTRGPSDRDAALTYAVLLVGRHLLEEAMGVLRRALVHHAQDVGLQLAQAEALLMEGDFESATDLLDGLRTVSTLQPRHLSFAGDLYLDMERADEAIECYRKALDRGVDSAEIAYRLALLLNEDEQPEAAAHYLEKAARFAEDNPTLWEMAAEACYEIGRVDDAIDAYEKMLEQRPHDAQGWFMLGLSYWMLDRFADAVPAFEKVIDLNPRHRVAWRQLGQTYLAMGHGERALQAFRRVLELDPDDLEALDGAVMAAHEIGDVEAAVEWAERAVELAPHRVDSRFNLANVYLTRGHAMRARSILGDLVDSGDGQLGTFLAALAVAEMMTDRFEEAFEHIGEAQRLDVEPKWLAAFAEELLKSRGPGETMDFLERTTCQIPGWKVVEPMIGYVCSALAEDDGRAAEYAARFRRRVDQHPEAIPVRWDFDSWEAFAFRLQRRFERVFDAVLAVIEGRRSIDEIESTLQEAIS